MTLFLHSAQVFADAVSHLVIDKFSQLTDKFTSSHSRRKVLAGVVMTTGIIFIIKYILNTPLFYGFIEEELTSVFFSGFIKLFNTCG